MLGGQICQYPLSMGYVTHAMMPLVRNFALPRAMYACQVWIPDMLQLSPCGQFSLQSELLSICKHVLGLRGSVAQASQMSLACSYYKSSG
jgi:hypothetical protein